MNNTAKTQIETVRVENPTVIAEHLGKLADGERVEVAVQWYSYDTPRVRDAVARPIHRGGDVTDIGVEIGIEWFSLDSVKAVFVPVDDYDLPTVLCDNCGKRSEYVPKATRNGDGELYSLCLNCCHRVPVKQAAPASQAGAAGSETESTDKAFIKEYLTQHEGATVRFRSPVYNEVLTGVVRWATGNAKGIGIASGTTFHHSFNVKSLFIPAPTPTPDPLEQPVGKLIDELDAAVAHLAGQAVFDSPFAKKYTSRDFHHDIQRLTKDILEKWGCELGSWSVSVKSGAATRWQQKILKYERPFRPDSKTAQKLGVIDSVFFSVSVEDGSNEMTIPELLRLAAIKTRRERLAAFNAAIAKKAAEIVELTESATRIDEDLTALLSEFKRGDRLKLTDGGLETLLEWRVRDLRGGGVDCVAIMNGNFTNPEKPFERIFTVAELRKLKAKVVGNEPFVE
jgi:hypothetical protein